MGIFTILDAYKLIFMVALLSAEYMLLLQLPKKQHFAARVSVAVIGHLILALLYPNSQSNELSLSVMFSVFYVSSVFMAKGCFDISWNSCLFCILSGYSIQHIASIVYNIMLQLVGLGRMNSLYSDAPVSFGLLPILIFLQVYTLIYFSLYHLFVKRIGKNEEVTITNPALFGLIGLVMLVEIILNAFVVYHGLEQMDLIYYLCASITNLLCSLCVLVILFGQLLRKNLEQELQVVHQLRKQERRQYDITKETIDMINIKCHDMKHQIHTIRHSGSITNEALKEVEKSIDIYDSIVKTGCEALDVILAEKALFCQKNNISINSIADGERLSFMNDADIYSLFGNLIDNAIHSVIRQNVEQRIISLHIKLRGQLLSINMHNPYLGTIKIENGIPQTENQDKSTHGFGIKSMMMTVEKYGGTISFNTADKIFNVDILFPLTEDGKDRRHAG